MIEARELSKTYYSAKNRETKALDGISFSIKSGEFVAVVGTSGAGKTTLLNVLALLSPPSRGKLYFDNVDCYAISDLARARLRNKKIGFVFQQYLLLEDLSVLENVLLPLSITGERGKSARTKAADALARLELSHLLQQKVSTLSGGEAQRVAIARALVNNPQIIFADEPTGNLDNVNSSAVISILSNINKEGRTVIIVTHDTDIAARCGRIITLSDGHIVSDVVNLQQASDF